MKLPRGTTPSNVKLKDLIENGLHIVPVYYHYFSLELYNMYTSIPDNLNGDIEFVLNGVSCNVSKKSLDELFTRFMAITAIPLSRVVTSMGILSTAANVKKCESTQSTLLASLLNDFFHANNPDDDFVCGHQVPVYSKGSGIERADFYVMGFDKSSMPSLPILVSDYKCTEYSDAYQETIGYAVRVLEMTNDYYGLLLGLVVTSLQATLLVCVAQTEITLCIDMFPDGVKLGNQGEFKKFFALLCGAVNSLLRKPISLSINVFEVFPLRNGVFPTSCDSDERVFCHGDTIYKIFNDSTSEMGLSPNVEAIKAISNDYLPNLKLEILSRDRRFQRLQYSFLPGSHSPRNLKQFLCILKALQKLHKAGFVHSDIRFRNLIFHDSEDKAWLIDFDLAGQEKMPYPESYNRVKIKERHPTARKLKPRLVQHDVHSIYTIIRSHFPKFPECNLSLEDIIFKINELSSS